MQEPMLTFRRVTKETLRLEHFYPSTIILSAFICMLVLYICYLYRDILERGGTLGVAILLASLVLFVLVAALLRVLLLWTKQVSLLNAFSISPKAETVRYSLNICGALALLAILYCLFFLRPLHTIAIAAGMIFSITSFWPYLRYSLQLAKNIIQDIWRWLLHRPYILEVILVDARKDPFDEEK